MGNNADWTAFFFGLTFVLHFFFAGGMFALLPYWLIHHSNLRVAEPNRQ